MNCSYLFMYVKVIGALQGNQVGLCVLQPMPHYRHFKDRVKDVGLR